MKNHSVNPSVGFSDQITHAIHGAKTKPWRISTNQRKDKPPRTRFRSMFQEAWINAATITKDKLVGVIKA
jgi:hypothetical protein